MRTLVMLLIISSLALACIDVQAIPSTLSPRQGEELTVLFLVKFTCSGEAKVIVNVKNAAITSTTNFVQVSGGTATWSGTVTKGNTITLKMTLIPTSNDVEITYLAFFNGIQESTGKLVLGKGTSSCLFVRVGPSPLGSNFQGFKVVEGSRMLGISVVNLCNKEINVPIVVNFVHSTPAKKALISLCMEYRSNAYPFPACAEYMGVPVKRCVKTSNTGPFVTVLKIRNPEPYDVRCGGCKLVKSTKDLRIYKCNWCKSERVSPEYPYRIEVRKPVCYQSVCSKWTKVLKVVKYCTVMRSFEVASNLTVSGKFASGTIRLEPQGTVVIGIPYTVQASAYMLGYLNEYVRIPIAYVDVGGVRLTSFDYVENKALGLTNIMYVLTLLSLVIIAFKIVGVI